jgi:hypothetical protein
MGRYIRIYRLEGAIAMKRFFIFCASLIASQALLYAGTITRPNTYTSGDTIRSADVNSNETTIYNEFNGSINDDNITDNSLTAASLAANAVDTSEITNSAVTLPKLTSAGSLNGMVLTATSPATAPIWSYAGKVQQYKFHSVVPDSTTVATVFVPTTSTATITLISTNSVVFVQASGAISNSNGTSQCFSSIYRDTTNLAGGSDALSVLFIREAGVHESGASMTYIDTGPFTAGTAYAYHVRIRTDGNSQTCGWGNTNDNVASTLAVIEFTP